MRLGKFIYLNTAILFLIAALLSMQNPTPVLGNSLSKTTPTLPTQPTPTQQSIDLSKVNWTELARLVYGRCGEYYTLALQAGWPASQWPTLSKVMYRESRCNTTSFNRSDPNGGSRGLIQINGYWCRKNKYNPNGWLQQKSILSTCNDLFDPMTNLKAGWAMWQYSQDRNGCGWRPWATRCS